jgi:phospholipid transport system substrate-binding protein
MIKRPVLPAVLIVAALLLPAWPVGAAAQGAQDFIRNLGNEAIEVLGPGIPQEQRVARFRELFDADFDVPEIARFVLGRYWWVATPDERQEFTHLFQEYIVRAYSARLGEYSGEPFRVEGARPAGDETVVTSQIVEGGGEPLIIDWYVTETGAGYKITDVHVGGVSMAVTERDEFASVIQRSGGVAGLIAQLRQKLTAG